MNLFRSQKVNGEGDKSDRCWSVSREDKQRSKVKVTRSTNAETGSASYLPNGNAHELETGTQMEHDVSSTSAVTSSKVKDQGRKVTWSV